MYKRKRDVSLTFSVVSPDERTFQKRQTYTQAVTYIDKGTSCIHRETGGMSFHDHSIG